MFENQNLTKNKEWIHLWYCGRLWTTSPNVFDHWYWLSFELSPGSLQVSIRIRPIVSDFMDWYHLLFWPFSAFFQPTLVPTTIALRGWLYFCMRITCFTCCSQRSDKHSQLLHFLSLVYMLMQTSLEAIFCIHGVRNVLQSIVTQGLQRILITSVLIKQNKVN